MTKEDILQTIENQKNFIKQEFGVEKIGQFVIRS